MIAIQLVKGHGLYSSVDPAIALSDDTGPTSIVVRPTLKKNISFLGGFVPVRGGGQV